MKKREFSKALKQITTKGKLDISKIPSLPIETRDAMVYHIIRNRGPVVKELITTNINQSWLNSMGYLYQTKGKEYIFIHTSENQIK